MSGQCRRPDPAAATRRRRALSLRSDMTDRGTRRRRPRRSSPVGPEAQKLSAAPMRRMRSGLTPTASLQIASASSSSSKTLTQMRSAGTPKTCGWRCCLFVWWRGRGAERQRVFFSQRGSASQPPVLAGAVLLLSAGGKSWILRKGESGKRRKGARPAADLCGELPGHLAGIHLEIVAKAAEGTPYTSLLAAVPSSTAQRPL